MIILRKYKSVVFWLMFVSLWIIGCLPKCNEDETKEKVNTNENKQPNEINQKKQNNKVNNNIQEENTLIFCQGNRFRIINENLKKSPEKIEENNKETEVPDNNIKKLKKKNEELSKENSIIKNEEIIKAKEEFKKAKYDLQLKEKELNDKNKSLENKKKNLDELETNLKKEKENIKLLQNELEEKKNSIRQAEPFNEENIKLTIKFKKEKEENEKQKKLNKEKEANIKIREKQLLEKENKFFMDIKKREDKLKEDQKKFNKEKLFYENIIDQKEDSFKKRELAIKNDKIFLENERKKLEMAKLPTEIGLQNIGATCYMNATLQALSNTGKFTEYFLKNYQYNQNNHNRKMSNEMYKVLFNLWSEEKKKGDYPPYDFKKALSEENPLFAGIQANDSKDLINFLLERFHQELNNANIIINNQGNNFVVDQTNEIQTLNNFITDYFSNNKSIITDCFYGILETKSKCGGCNCIKYNFQIYSFLEFPLKDINNYMYQNGRRYALVNQDGTNPDIDLYECFDYYQKIDLMTGPNQMYCNTCNGNKDTFYGSSIYSLPNYLIINLNRGKGAVYSCNVKFPDTLNLLNYVTYKDGITAMKLYAVICHYGPSNMGGHFIAFCRHRITNKWYKYNDSIVTLCTKDKEYLQGMPYILFYQAV